MSGVKVYFEGAQTGANSKFAQIEARRAFRSLAEKLQLSRQPGFVACGSRRNAFEDFCTALKNAGGQTIVMLLVDSEEPVQAAGVWKHLLDHDRWEKPSGVTEDHAHMMVQCMESWLIADLSTLEQFYHNDDFHAGQIPRCDDIEEISKDSVFRALRSATAHCKGKGSYDKAGHSWKLLSLVDPALIESKSPHAKRFFDALRRYCGSAQPPHLP